MINQCQNLTVIRVQCNENTIVGVEVVEYLGNRVLQLGIERVLDCSGVVFIAVADRNLSWVAVGADRAGERMTYQWPVNAPDLLSLPGLGAQGLRCDHKACHKQHKPHGHQPGKSQPSA